MLRKSLASLPQTLDQTYDRILTSISEEDRTYAMRMLQWLTFSERPLTVEEVAEVVAIDPTRDPAFDRDEILEDALEALNICSSLVVITTQEATDTRPTRCVIGLAHYSVQEYLLSDRIKRGQATHYSMQQVEVHNVITRCSLMYLLQLRPAETLESFALAKYAAKYWPSHFEAGGEAEEESLLAMKLLSIDSPAYLNWLQLADSRNWKSSWEKQPDNVPTPLCYAAFHGLTAVTRLLLEKGADVNVHGEWVGNALHAASIACREQIVNMLLDKGADINAQREHYGTALRLAVRPGGEKTVGILLERGADPNAPLSELRNIILPEASSEGLTQIVKMLLERGVDPNMISDGYFNRTALQEASVKGHEEVVRLLLDHKADVNIGGKFKISSYIDGERQKDVEYSSALHAASANGHYRIVKMLLDAGAQRHEGDDHAPTLE
jgi:hypothetical protein